jgi:hypothetical protein
MLRAACACGDCARCAREREGMGDEDLNANELLGGGEPPGEDEDYDDASQSITLAADKSYIYGRLIKVAPGTTAASPVDGVHTPIETRERVWSITIQQTAPAPIADGNDVNVYVVYAQGQAKFTKGPIDIGSTNTIRFSVVARHVEVYLTKAGGPPALVNVAVVPGKYTGSDYYGWQWATSISGADFGLMTTQPGVLGQVHVILRAIPGAATPLWPLLFDQPNNAQPAATTIPLRGGRLDALSNVGDGRTMVDEVATGTVAWSKGLVVALSTRPDQYLAPVAGNNITIDLKYGQ